MSDRSEDTERIGNGAEARPSLCLLIYSRAGSSLVPLQDPVSLIIGRGDTADVVIADSSLSRAHARIERAGNSVTITDLGSTNGVIAGGARVEHREIKPGDEVLLGAARVSLHDPVRRDQLQSGFVAHETLLLLLDHEMARARHAGRGVVLALARGGEIGAKASLLTRPLRPIDRLTFYGPDAVLLLLPDLGPGEGRRLLAGVCSQVGLTCGMAEYPGSATTAEAMVEAARHAADRSGGPDPIAAAPAGGGDPTPGESDPVVSSPAMRALFDQAGRLAASKIPVVILGESGSGKEIVARAIHRLGARPDRPLICLNCASIPPQLVEATLFGHIRGAFTGALRDAPGVFGAADGGTLFLDEIGELPLPVQAALLRVLETGEVTPVGSTKPGAVDVRIIAATNRDLEAASERGEFRRDLLFRLEGMTLHVPPLRERGEEIRPLAERFLTQGAKESGRAVPSIDPCALDVLHRYPWPGNVRELRNAIARALIVARGTTITLEDLPERVIRGVHRLGFDPAPAPAGDDPIDLKEQIRQTEARLILDALRIEGWNQSRAADRLRIPLRTLTYKIRAHGIRRLGYELS